VHAWFSRLSATLKHASIVEFIYRARDRPLRLDVLLRLFPRVAFLFHLAIDFDSRWLLFVPLYRPPRSLYLFTVQELATALGYVAKRAFASLRARA
jgi:hypothetical protein